MVVHRSWDQECKGRRHDLPAHLNRHFKAREGWFLFGLIPLYIRDA